MKKTKQCPKCHSLHVGYFPSIPDQAGASPFPDRGIGVIPSESVWRADKIDAYLEAYVCGACGYTETYVKAVEAVSFEKLDGFRWLDASAEEGGPYR